MKVKERKDMTKLRLNDGALNIAIDRKGNVLEWGEDPDEGYRNKWLHVLDAKELDQIAAKSRLLESVKNKIEELLGSIGDFETLSHTQVTDHEIGFNYDTYGMDDHDINGTVTFGCQEISPEDVARVHAISRKARGLKPLK